MEEKSKKRRRQRRGKRRKKDDETNEAEDIERLFVGYELPAEIPSDPEPEITAVKPAPLPQLTPRHMPLASVSMKPTDAGQSANDLESAFAKGRHAIRRLRNQLEEQTKIAGKMEADRRERIKKLHDKVSLLCTIITTTTTTTTTTVVVVVVAA